MFTKRQVKAMLDLINSSVGKPLFLSGVNIQDGWAYVGSELALVRFKLDKEDGFIYLKDLQDAYKGLKKPTDKLDFNKFEVSMSQGPKLSTQFDLNEGSAGEELSFHAGLLDRVAQALHHEKHIKMYPQTFPGKYVILPGNSKIEIEAVFLGMRFYD